MSQPYLEIQETGRQGLDQVEMSEALVSDTNFKGMLKKKNVKHQQSKAKPYFNATF